MQSKKCFVFCIDVYKTYEGNDYDKIYEVLSTRKNKKIKINNILNEKNRDLLKNPDFEQNKNLLTSTSICKIAHDSIRILNWIHYYDRSFYEKISFYDLMGSILSYLNEISKR